MEIRKITKIFEAYALFSQGMAGEPSDKPNAKKCFGRRAEAGNPQGADEAQINMFRSRKPNAKVMKCFSCRKSRHGVKEYQKPKKECLNCWFLDGGHKKEC